MIGLPQLGPAIPRRSRSARPAEAPPARVSAGFTLLEMLLVLALLALLAGLLIGGSMAMLSQKNPSLDEVFWKAVQEARHNALQNSRDVHLRFEPKEKTLVLDDGFASRSFPLPSSTVDDVSVDFLSTQKTGGTILLGGTVVETQPLPAGVTFYDDGTCTPFRVQLRSNGGAHILAIDPWTCAAVLAANDPLNP